MSIITRGLGGKSLITQGYGGKWTKEKLPEKRRMEICPYCGAVLKYSLYSSKDPFSGRKIFKCSECYEILKFEDGKWRRVKPWYED